MPRLKVYAAPMGFYDTVIAAPSQKAALAAWGTAQNLFHDGAARVCDDPAAVAAALERPGVLLRRPAGARGPYAENAPPPALPKSAGAKSATKAPAPKPNKKPAEADRRALDRARAALAALAERHERERRDLEEQAARLKQRAAEQERAHREAKAKLTENLIAAERAWRAAAGR